MVQILNICNNMKCTLRNLVIMQFGNIKVIAGFFNYKV